MKTKKLWNGQYEVYTFNHYVGKKVIFVGSIEEIIILYPQIFK